VGAETDSFIGSLATTRVQFNGAQAPGTQGTPAVPPQYPSAYSPPAAAAAMPAAVPVPAAVPTTGDFLCKARALYSCA
jgi:hypothetical protein